MDLPSERYFELVKTEEDYNKFTETGMAWEVEVFCPFTWSEHLKMVDFKKKKKDYYNRSKVSNYKASCKLEGL